MLDAVNTSRMPSFFTYTRHSDPSAFIIFSFFFFFLKYHNQLPVLCILSIYNNASGTHVVLHFQFFMIQWTFICQDCLSVTPLISGKFVLVIIVTLPFLILFAFIFIFLSIMVLSSDSYLCFMCTQ